jgi:hypothetical protein
VRLYGAREDRPACSYSAGRAVTGPDAELWRALTDLRSCPRRSLYWMKDVTKSDLRKRNGLDRKYMTDDEIDSVHLANISRAWFLLSKFP